MNDQLELGPHFDGETYQPAEDHVRLSRQVDRVLAYMLAKARDAVETGCESVGWRTLPDVSRALGIPEASVSARLRDLRKSRFGGWTVERTRLAEPGLFAYRIVIGS